LTSTAEKNLKDRQHEAVLFTPIADRGLLGGRSSRFVQLVGWGQQPTGKEHNGRNAAGFDIVDNDNNDKPVIQSENASGGRKAHFRRQKLIFSSPASLTGHCLEEQAEIAEQAKQRILERCRSVPFETDMSEPGKAIACQRHQQQQPVCGY
jgi:hypothetical protein